MNTRTIKIADATAAELHEFARDTLGASLPANAKAPALIAKISAMHSGDSITVSVREADVATATVPMADGAPVKKEREYCTIFIETQEVSGGDEPVPVSVNGKCMLIERGKDQKVPVEYYEVLKNAVQEIFDPEKDGGLKPARYVMTHPVRLIAA